MGEIRRSKAARSGPAPMDTAARLRWSKMAPLGSPVVPLVQTRATVRAGSGAGRRAGGPSWRRPGSSERSRVRRPSGGVPLAALGDQKARLAAAQDAGHLGRSEPGVDTGGDGAQAHGGQVADGVVDAGGEEEGDDVTDPDPEIGKGGRGAVGRSVPGREGESLAVPVHIRLAVSVRRRHGPQQLIGGGVGELHGRLGNGRQGQRGHVGMLSMGRPHSSCGPTAGWLVFMI